MQMTEKNVWAHLSQRIAMRLQSLMRPNVISTLCRWR